MIDAFLVFLMYVGGVQFVYACLTGGYPFNSFLAGFSQAVGQFVLTGMVPLERRRGCFAVLLFWDFVIVFVGALCAVLSLRSSLFAGILGAADLGQWLMVASLRSQVDKANRTEFPEVSPERYPLKKSLVTNHFLRAFADFVFSSIVLHFFAINFLG